MQASNDDSKKKFFYAKVDGPPRGKDRPKKMWTELVK